MKQLLEFIPLVLFFITYKMFGVRDAAIVLVIATIVQMIVLKLKYGVIEETTKNHCNCRRLFWFTHRLFQ